MVKGRLRTLNHANLRAILHGAYMAHGCGASAHYRSTAGLYGPLVSLKKKEKTKPYLTNLSVLRFNSTLTFLPNTNVYPCTLVLPT